MILVYLGRWFGSFWNRECLTACPKPEARAGNTLLLAMVWANTLRGLRSQKRKRRLKRRPSHSAFQKAYEPWDTFHIDVHESHLPKDGRELRTIVPGTPVSVFVGALIGAPPCALVGGALPFRS